MAGCWIRIDVSVLVPDEDCNENHVENEVYALLRRTYGIVTIHGVEKEED